MSCYDYGISIVMEFQIEIMLFLVSANWLLRFPVLCKPTSGYSISKSYDEHIPLIHAKVLKKYNCIKERLYLKPTQVVYLLVNIV